MYIFINFNSIIPLPLTVVSFHLAISVTNSLILMYGFIFVNRCIVCDEMNLCFFFFSRFVLSMGSSGRHFYWSSHFRAYWKICKTSISSLPWIIYWIVKYVIWSLFRFVWILQTIIKFEGGIEDNWYINKNTVTNMFL